MVVGKLDESPKKKKNFFESMDFDF